MQELAQLTGIAVDIRTEGGIIKGKLILVHREILYQNERNKIKYFWAFAFSQFTMNIAYNRHRSWGPLPQALCLLSAISMSELLECLDAQRDNEDTTNNGKGDTNNARKSRGHFTSNRSQGSGQCFSHGFSPFLPAQYPAGKG